MASYKEMTDRQILNKYYYYISKVNISLGLHDAVD